MKGAAVRGIYTFADSTTPTSLLTHSPAPQVKNWPINFALHSKCLRCIVFANTQRFKASGGCFGAGVGVVIAPSRQMRDALLSHTPHTLISLWPTSPNSLIPITSLISICILSRGGVVILETNSVEDRLDLNTIRKHDHPYLQLV